MAKISDTALTGISGRTYRFGVFTLDVNFRNMGAVYVFAHRTMDPLGQERHHPIYIGQTGELGDWLTGHRDWPLLKQKEANCVCVHIDWNENLRAKIENDLIGYYRPPCNN